MLNKELVEVRWKIIIGMLLSLSFIVILSISYNSVKNAANTIEMRQVTEGLPDPLRINIDSYGSYIWREWFVKDVTLVLGLLSIVIGSGYVATEANKGTIFLLLSRPISRSRILLTKYGVGAIGLLIISLAAALTLLAASALAGNPQNMGGVLVSAVLSWLAIMFLLGVATLFSVLFRDATRPLLLTVLVWSVTGLVGLFPDLTDWSLPHYWASQSAFDGQTFPLKELLICLVVAAGPVLVALTLFRRKTF